jgi:anti-sigma factor RsiW
MSGEMNAECAAVLREISAYVDGELDATQCDSIEAHCRTCASCAAVVHSLRETIGLCRGAAVTPVPESVRARARASIDALLRGRTT